MKIALGYLFSALYVGLCLLAALGLGRLGVRREYSRKAVHILVGLEWWILAYFFGPGGHTFAVCLIFTALLFLDDRRRLIRAMSSDGENAHGTVLYGVSMTVMAAVSWIAPATFLPFGAAVVCTSLGDGLAGVVGMSVRRANPKIFRQKTLLGTLACLAVSFLSLLVFRAVSPFGLGIYECLAVAAFAALLELFTTHGFDNISLPLGVFALSTAFLFLPGTPRYLCAILLSPAVIGIVSEKKILTPAATAAAFLMDLCVTAAFADPGFLLLLLFLAGGALTDRLRTAFHSRRGKRRAARIGERIGGASEHIAPLPDRDEDESASGARGVRRVLANGALPTLLAVASLILTAAGVSVPDGLLPLLYLSAVAEAFADTCASAFGALAGRAYDPFRRAFVPKGISGGMSLPGTAAALAASLLLPALALAFGFVGWRQALAAAVCAFLGTLLDSLLGSLLQVKYRCRVCHALTEKRSHCGLPSEYERGAKRIDNSAVNLLSECASLLLALAAFLLIL